jgi:hypothetical protein
VTELYSYNSPIRFSYNGDISPLTSRESVIFIHENGLTCEKSLVIIHNKVGGEYKVAMTISGNLQFPVVRDDLSGDKYVYYPTTQSTIITWDSPAGTTDGMAHVLATFPPGACISLSPNFFERAGLAQWAWLEPADGPQGDGSIIHHLMPSNQNIRICHGPSPNAFDPGECPGLFCFGFK